eukprot:COSAG05_NODE_798_length_7245_cov_46.630982_7_plen_156_part_00
MLLAELHGILGLAGIWNFLVVDGFSCTRGGNSMSKDHKACREQGNQNLANIVTEVWRNATGVGGSIVPYECRSGPETFLTGWCLGSVRRGGVPARRNYGDHESQTLHALSSLSFLGVGDYLESAEKAYYLSMQEDGNLVIYKNNEGGEKRIALVV